MSAANAIATPSQRERSNRRPLTVLAVGLTAVAAGTLWYLTESAERSAITELPAVERKALYARTLNTLKSSCSARNKPRGLDDFCREQAAFIVQFPECDAACRRVASLHQGPTR